MCTLFPHHPGSLYSLSPTLSSSFPPMPHSLVLPLFFSLFPRRMELLIFTSLLLEWGSSNYERTAHLTTGENVLIVIGCEWSGRGCSYTSITSPGNLLTSQSPASLFCALALIFSIPTGASLQNCCDVYASFSCFHHTLKPALWGRELWVDSVRINWLAPLWTLICDGLFSSCLGAVWWKMSE